jgi:hypothetical protein
MEQTPERRRYERFACGSTLQWAYFNRTQFHNARMSNFSHAGVCFESPEALVPGASVLVRLENYQAECTAECRDKSDCPWPRSIAVGEVKWCRDATDGGPSAFGAGVRFHLPV